MQWNQTLMYCFYCADLYSQITRGEHCLSLKPRLEQCATRRRKEETKMGSGDNVLKTTETCTEDCPG